MKILVIGDYISDVYTFGTATRLCPEAPVPVLVPIEERRSAGGAGLVASQLGELEANVHCAYGSYSTKHRYFAGSHLICRIDNDSEETHVPITDELLRNLADDAVIVVSDYGKGAMTPELASQIVATGKPCFVDAKHHWTWYVGQNAWMFPNALERQTVDTLRHETLIGVATEFKVIEKLGAGGCRMKSEKEGTSLWHNFPAAVTEVVDTTGAGDIFMASFVYAWSLQLPAEDCLRFANELAGESCRHRGTYVVPKEFAQSVLDKLLVSAKLQRQIPDCSLDSNWSSIPPKHVQDHVEAIAAETLASNPDVDYVQVLGGPAGGPCNFPVGQIRRKSPSVPNESSDAQPPVDQQSSDSADNELRSEQPSRNSTETEHQYGYTPTLDQGELP